MLNLIYIYSPLHIHPKGVYVIGDIGAVLDIAKHSEIVRKQCFYVFLKRVRAMVQDGRPSCLQQHGLIFD